VLGCVEKRGLAGFLARFRTVEDTGFSLCFYFFIYLFFKYRTGFCQNSHIIKTKPRTQSKFSSLPLCSALAASLCYLCSAVCDVML